jgi:hypothetical protein
MIQRSLGSGHQTGKFARTATANSFALSKCIAENREVFPFWLEAPSVSAGALLSEQRYIFSNRIVPFELVSSTVAPPLPMTPSRWFLLPASSRLTSKSV